MQKQGVPRDKLGGFDYSLIASNPVLSSPDHIYKAFRSHTPSYHCPHCLPALRPPPPLCTLAGRAEQRQPLHCCPLSHPHPILPLSSLSPCSPPFPSSMYSDRSGRAETAPTLLSPVSPSPHLTIVLIVSLLSALPLLYVL